MTTTTITNRTPHAVNLYQGETLVATYEPAGPAARVVYEDNGETTVTLDEGLDVAVGQGKTMVGTENVPDPQDGVLYLVARLVIQALPDRDDLVAPDDLVRDDAGRVIGCRRFSR